VAEGLAWGIHTTFSITMPDKYLVDPEYYISQGLDKATFQIQDRNMVPTLRVIAGLSDMPKRSYKTIQAAGFPFKPSTTGYTHQTNEDERFLYISYGAHCACVCLAAFPMCATCH
jgi:hypothetical protein